MPRERWTRERFGLSVVWTGANRRYLLAIRQLATVRKLLGRKADPTVDDILPDTVDSACAGRKPRISSVSDLV